MRGCDYPLRTAAISFDYVPPFHEIFSCAEATEKKKQNYKLFLGDHSHSYSTIRAASTYDTKVNTHWRRALSLIIASVKKLRIPTNTGSTCLSYVFGTDFLTKTKRSL